MTRPDEKLLLDMLLSARRAREYVREADREKFDSDTILQDGIVRCLEPLVPTEDEI